MMNLSQILDHYLDHLAVTGKATSLKTARSHAGAIAFAWPLGGEDADLSHELLDKFISNRRKIGDSTATINGRLKILRAALRHAERDEARYVKLLRETRVIPKVLSPDEVNRVWKVAPTHGARLAILFAADAGLRHQEITHLTHGDIGGGEVRVTAKEWTEPGQGRCVAMWSPKGHAERAVPLTKRLSDAYTDYAFEKLHEGSARAAGQAADWFLFYVAGDMTRPARDLFSTMSASFQRAGLATAGTKPGLHMLRRSWASELLGRGADIETVRELGGWADLATVQRYLASTDDRKRAAIAALGRD